MLTLTHSVKALESMIHFSFQKLEMGFPKFKESEKQLQFDSKTFYSQSYLQQAILSCSPVVLTLSEVKTQQNKSYDIKESRASVEIKVHYCLIKFNIQSPSVKVNIGVGLHPIARTMKTRIRADVQFYQLSYEKVQSSKLGTLPEMQCFPRFSTHLLQSQETLPSMCYAKAVIRTVGKFFK